MYYTTFIQIAELSAEEARWQNGPNASRNTRLLKRWKHDLKVLIGIYKNLPNFTKAYQQNFAFI